ncbi:MAG TPA: hypothetical protein VEJ87_15715 [Acidimicrobiales bacterium]|nr:hypothetical protein [Acidimicrobiales bacterium]
MRAAAVLLGLVALGGLIVLAIAGVSGAEAILVAAFAILVMIALGSILGGRKGGTSSGADRPGHGQSAGGPSAGGPSAGGQSAGDHSGGSGAQE